MSEEIEESINDPLLDDDIVWSRLTSEEDLKDGGGEGQLNAAFLVIWPEGDKLKGLSLLWCSLSHRSR